MGISETIFIFAWLYKIKATHAVVAQLAERILSQAAGHEFDLAYRSKVYLLN